MLLIQTFDPELGMPSYDMPIESEADAEARVMEDGAWTASTNSSIVGLDPLTGEMLEGVETPMPWGVAKYGGTFYLWSGPYDESGGTAKFQVDTYTIGGS